MMASPSAAPDSSSTGGGGAAHPRAANPPSSHQSFRRVWQTVRSRWDGVDSGAITALIASTGPAAHGVGAGTSGGSTGPGSGADFGLVNPMHGPAAAAGGGGSGGSVSGSSLGRGGHGEADVPAAINPSVAALFDGGGASLRSRLRNAAARGEDELALLVAASEDPAGGPSETLRRLHSDYHLYNSRRLVNQRNIQVGQARRGSMLNMSVLVKDGESMLCALCVASALCCLEDALLACLDPFEEQVEFWGTRRDESVVELIESLPEIIGAWIWPSVNSAASPSQKLQVLRQLQAELQAYLGRTRRCLLLLQHATTSAHRRDSLEHGLQTLESILMPNGVPRHSGRDPLEQLTRLFDATGLLDNGRVSSVESLKANSAEALQPLMGRRWLARRWLRVAIFGSVVVVVGWRNRHRIQDWRAILRRTGKSIMWFLSEHVAHPVSEIWAEVFKGKSLIADDGALRDATQSLDIMLANFAKQQQMPETAISRAVASRDMSFVSRQYEVELQHPLKNLVAGDLVQMMLIQIQFIKREVMVALDAVDKLLAANQFNLQMLAIIPAFVVLTAMGRGVRATYTYITAPTSTRDLRRKIKHAVRDIDRLLTLAMSPTPSGMDSPNRGYRTEDFAGLTDAQLGELVELVVHLRRWWHELTQRGIMGSRTIVSPGELIRFEQDLDDLGSESLTIMQRSRVVTRMLQTHAVLTSARESVFLDLV